MFVSLLALPIFLRLSLGGTLSLALPPRCRKKLSVSLRLYETSLTFPQVLVSG